jgi:hypothetical protein
MGKLSDARLDKADRSVFAKLPNNDLKLNYGDGTGVNVHFKGFEEYASQLYIAFAQANDQLHYLEPPGSYRLQDG